ncbi:MAG: glycosyltransferase family 4 protein, partial [Patescibacteria group bacterium]|nr:glycosyltransferase family 4 protein [Patescibacteria group bacterium]
MKRIAIFSITFHPFIGGAEIAIKEITDRIAGYEFVLYTAKLSDALPDVERMGNILVHRIGTGRRRLDKWLYPFGAARLALIHHKEKPFTMVWAVMATYAGLAALLFKKRQPHVPYLLTLQSGDPDEFIQKRTWFWKKTYAKIYTKADKIIAISSWLAARAKRYGYADAVAIVPNGVDVSNFSGALMRKDERAFIRKAWGLGPD